MDVVTLAAAKAASAPRTLSPTDGLRSWGHSYPAGVNSAGLTSITKGFAAIAAELLGLDLRNNAIGGTSLYYGINSDSAWPAILQNVSRPLSGRFNSGLGLVTSMYGINDVNKLGNTYGALAPFMMAQRVAISRWRAGAIFEDTDASVAYGGAGVWTFFGVLTSNSGTGYRYNPTSGGTLTITTPPDFPGGTIALGFTSRASGNGGVVSGTVNGIVYSVDTSNNRTDSAQAFVLRIPNVPAGSAAYVFTTSAVIGVTWGVMFDYWQWEPAEADCPLVVLVKQPKPIDYTAYGAVNPGPPTDAGVDALNQVFTDLAAEFGSRVITVDTSSIDHDLTCFTAGNVHPSAKGHLVIARLVVAAVLAKLRVQQRRPVIAPRVEYGIAAPTTSYVSWAVGDQVVNTAPAEAGAAASKYVTTGWICTVAGAPGTWLPLRSLTGN